MNTNVELLRDICRNAEMGEATITRLLPRVQSQRFRSALHEQLDDYRYVLTRAQRLARQQHISVRGLNPMARQCAAAMIRAKTAVDPSASHMAAMMMQGSNMGIIDMTRQLKRTPQLSSPVKALANDLLSIEQRNLENMKAFL